MILCSGSRQWLKFRAAALKPECCSERKQLSIRRIPVYTQKPFKLKALELSQLWQTELKGILFVWLRRAFSEPAASPSSESSSRWKPSPVRSGFRASTSPPRTWRDIPAKSVGSNKPEGNRKGLLNYSSAPRFGSISQFSLCPYDCQSLLTR